MYSAFLICESEFCSRLALLAVYRFGGHVPTPGINADKLAQFFDQNRGSFLGFVDLFSGGQLAPLDHLRAGHHAVHHGIDHSAADDRGLRAAGEAAEGRRAGPQEDHAVDSLPDLGLSAVQSLGIAYTLAEAA